MTSPIHCGRDMVRSLIRRSKAEPWLGEWVCHQCGHYGAPREMQEEELTQVSPLPRYRATSKSGL